MKIEHIIVSIVIMLVVLVALMLFGGQIIPIFTNGISGVIDMLKIK